MPTFRVRFAVHLAALVAGHGVHLAVNCDGIIAALSGNGAARSAAHGVFRGGQGAVCGGIDGALSVGVPLFVSAAICRREQRQGESLVGFSKILIV
jgi:hypothetical protein